MMPNWIKIASLSLIATLLVVVFSGFVVLGMLIAQGFKL